MSVNDGVYLGYYGSISIVEGGMGSFIDLKDDANERAYEKALKGGYFWYAEDVYKESWEALGPLCIMMWSG